MTHLAPFVRVARLLGALALIALSAGASRAQTPPDLWSCELPQKAFGEALRPRTLMVAVSPEGDCWRDWNPLVPNACVATRVGTELFIELPGRGQMAGVRWIIERGEPSVELSGCKVGDRPRGREPKSYASRLCICRRATLVAAAAGWRKAGSLDPAVALLRPYGDALVRGSPAAAPRAALDAVYELAALLDTRDGPGDREDGLRYATFAADRGQAEAAYLVGKAAERGLGGIPDYRAAAASYRRGAEAGSRRAMAALGILYERGVGVPGDLAEALRWYEAAKEAGSTTGMLRLGLLHLHGRGVPRDPAIAYQWLFGASLSEDPKTRADATRERDAAAQSLTPELRAEAEARFRAWQQARRAEKPSPPPR